MQNTYTNKGKQEYTVASRMSAKQGFFGRHFGSGTKLAAFAVTGVMLGIAGGQLVYEKSYKHDDMKARQELIAQGSNDYAKVMGSTRSGEFSTYGALLGAAASIIALIGWQAQRRKKLAVQQARAQAAKKQVAQQKPAAPAKKPAQAATLPQAKATQAPQQKPNPQAKPAAEAKPIAKETQVAADEEAKELREMAATIKELVAKKQIGQELTADETSNVYELAASPKMAEAIDTVMGAVELALLGYKDAAIELDFGIDRETVGNALKSLAVGEEGKEVLAEIDAARKIRAFAYLGLNDDEIAQQLGIEPGLVNWKTAQMHEESGAFARDRADGVAQRRKYAELALSGLAQKEIENALGIPDGERARCKYIAETLDGIKNDWATVMQFRAKIAEYALKNGYGPKTMAKKLQEEGYAGVTEEHTEGMLQVIYNNVDKFQQDHEAVKTRKRWLTIRGEIENAIRAGGAKNAKQAVAMLGYAQSMPEKNALAYANQAIEELKYLEVQKWHRDFPDKSAKEIYERVSAKHVYTGRNPDHPLELPLPYSGVKEVERLIGAVEANWQKKPQKAAAAQDSTI